MNIVHLVNSYYKLNKRIVNDNDAKYAIYTYIQILFCKQFLISDQNIPITLFIIY